MYGGRWLLKVFPCAFGDPFCFYGIVDFPYSPFVDVYDWSYGPVWFSTLRPLFVLVSATSPLSSVVPVYYYCFKTVRWYWTAHGDFPGAWFRLSGFACVLRCIMTFRLLSSYFSVHWLKSWGVGFDLEYEIDVHASVDLSRMWQSMLALVILWTSFRSIPFPEYGLVTSWVLKRISYLVLTLQEQPLDRCCVSSNISSVSFEAKFKLSQPKRETFSYVFLVG